MRLEIQCRACNKDFEIKSNAISRYDLENEIGRYFDAQCEHCSSSSEYHVNNVYAENSGANYALYAVMAFLAAIAILMFTLEAGIVSLVFVVLPIFIYFKMKQAREKSVEQFNTHTISTQR